MTITVSARKNGPPQCLTVTKRDNDHNDQVSEQACHLYPSVRRLTPEEREQQGVSKYMSVCPSHASRTLQDNN